MEEQVGFAAGIIIGLVILAVWGAIIGWLASVLVKGTGLGLGKDILLGIAGSIVGGWLSQALGLPLGGTILGGLLPALIGAVLILLVVEALRKR